MRKVHLLCPRFLLFIAIMTTCFAVNAQDMKVTAKQWIVNNSKALQLNQQELNELRINSAYTDNNGITFAYAEQYYKGVKVYNGVYSLAFKKGVLLSHASSFVSDMKTKVGSELPSLTAQQAVSIAAADIKAGEVAGLYIVSDKFAADKKITFNAAGIARDNINAELVWASKDNGRTVELTWNVNIDMLMSDDWMNVRVNAKNGQVYDKDNWTVNENLNAPGSNELLPGLTRYKRTSSFKSDYQFIQPYKETGTSPLLATASYYILPFPTESPIFGPLATVTNPWLLAGATNNAITNGWHYDGTTEFNFTSGNNVRAYDDRASLNAPGAYDTSSTALPSLTFAKIPNFTTAPIVTNFTRSATTNLFYVDNYIHDVAYQYGFDEPSRNFQVNNLGRGGLGNDPVRAEAQDGGGTNNANMATPADGGLPRMQMYLWNQPAPPILKVNTPAAIAATYFAVESNFSTANKLAAVGPVTANAILYNDDATGLVHNGCNLSNNIVTGKIALIYRGVCVNGFIQKVKNAQLSGALGVVMINNVSGNPIVMGGADNTITIPAVMVSDLDGALLVSQIANNENITLASPGVVQNVDGDYDNGIIAHEFTHGISNRLTGTGAGCLGNAEQGGEGWSDYFALMLTQNWSTTSVGDSMKKRPMGNYAFSYPTTGPGIRNYPYTWDMTINPLTYANMGVGTIGTEVHNLGEIWCATLWDMTWSIIGQTNSITSNIYNANGTGGNVIALKLVTMGFKLQPCGPGFLDARNAILKADSILYNSVHKCAIWKAFARRGMGVSAVQGLATSATDQVAAFDLPGAFKITKSAIPDIAADANSNITYTLSASCGCATPSGYAVRDTLGTGLTYVSSVGGTLSGNVVTFSPVSFTAPLQTLNYTLVAKPTIAGCPPVFSINSNVDDYNFGNLTPSLTGAPGGSAPGWYITSAKSHSVAKSWFGPETDAPSDESLVSDAVILTSTNSILSFWHSFNTETSYDGGVVEISTDNGVNWTDLGSKIISGGYPALMDPSTILAGRAAYTGTNGGFTFVKIDLSSYSGKTVKIRFRMTSDNGTFVEGWYIDDIQLVSGCGITNKAALYNAASVAVDSAKVFTLVTPATQSNSTIVFDAYANTNSISSHLIWNTNNETGISRFEVERSPNGTSGWIVVAATGAAGYTTAAATYERNDNSPIIGANYYRLKTYDRFGNFTYSVIRVVRFGNTHMFGMVPNLVNNSTYIVFNYRFPNGATLQVFDAAGKLMSSEAISNVSSSMTLNTSKLAAGTYMVTVLAADGETHSERMVVVH
ncbi:MAG: M36 family metallopeptidase [Ferruginibacter sp.]